MSKINSVQDNAADVGDDHDGVESDTPAQGHDGGRQQSGRRRVVRRAGPPAGTDRSTADDSDGSEIRVERPRIRPPAPEPATRDRADDDPAGERQSPGSVAGTRPASAPKGADPIAAAPPVDLAKKSPADETPSVAPEGSPSSGIEASTDEGSLDEDAAIETGAPRRRLLVPVVVALLLAGLVAAAGYLFVDNRSTEQATAQRDRLLQTARQTALNLTTLHAETAEQDVERLLAGASGAFLEQFQDRQSDFTTVVGQAGVNTDGTVVAAGIESTADNCAVSLVAANATITNIDVTEPQDRYFRFRITTCETDGNLTATDVEFVP